jgi:hypothetical protein
MRVASRWLSTTGGPQLNYRQGASHAKVNSRMTRLGDRPAAAQPTRETRFATRGKVKKVQQDQQDPLSDFVRACAPLPILVYIDVIESRPNFPQNPRFSRPIQHSGDGTRFADSSIRLLGLQNILRVRNERWGSCIRELKQARG